MLGDLAGLPLLINAPCPHFEQISMRESDAAVAPICPQLGQVIRVSMSMSIAGRKSVKGSSRQGLGGCSVHRGPPVSMAGLLADSVTLITGLPVP
jgi:hypothetical protein